MKILRVKVLFFLFACAVWLTFSSAVGAQEEDKPITHNVSVNMMLMPVFVTGPGGEPVYDLKKEDFQLYANDVPMEIRQFIRFDFEHREEVSEEVTVKGKPVKLQQPSRAVFIIIDAVFNRDYGYRRAKKIAADIIRNSSPGDTCIVLENRPNGNLRYLGGPETNRKSLMARIKKLGLPAQKFSPKLHVGSMMRKGYHKAVPPTKRDRFSLTRRRLEMEKMAYKNQVNYMSDLMERFKYALKTVTRPKVVFLISQGMDKGAFKEFRAMAGGGNIDKYARPILALPAKVNETNDFRERRMFAHLERAVRAVNEGGSVLYTVNPGRTAADGEASGEMSLRYLAYQSGGDYIAGRDTKRIIKRIKKTTAAYYELAFTPTPDLTGRRFDIRLECKRKGVKVNTFREAETSKPYYRMAPMEKKVFALNMATGGAWSRMAGKAARAPFQRFMSDVSAMIHIPLPKEIRNRPVDLFTIQMDPETGKTDIQMTSRTFADAAELPVKTYKDRDSFFVIVEPVFAYCLYNQI